MKRALTAVLVVTGWLFLAAGTVLFGIVVSLVVAGLR